MKKCLRFLSLLTLVIGLSTVTVPCLTTAEERGARLVCLNVGKADCLLLLWEDQAFLIDAGYEQNATAVRQMLSYYGVSRLNGVFLTHCHKDHQGGLMALAMADLTIDKWYAAELYYDEKPEKHAAALAAAARGDTVHWLSCGNTVPAGKNAAFTVLGPAVLDTENENNNSLVLRFDCPHGSILLAGDMKEDEEISLLTRGLLTPCELLKAGHHGDGSATKKAFLSAVRPRMALISTNSHEETDTPAPTMLERLTKIGCKYRVTQDAQDALEATLLNREVTVRDVAWPGIPARCTDLSMSINLTDDLLTIRNDSDASVTLNDAILYSSKGSDLFPLPSFTLAPGQVYRVGSKATKAEYDLRLDKKRVWHESKLDMAILYDSYGRGIAWADNGMEDE